ncbi:MAG: helix-turn-helix domain-containing protein, partial [Pirellulaceae bacterium]
WFFLFFSGKKMSVLASESLFFLPLGNARLGPSSLLPTPTATKSSTVSGMAQINLPIDQFVGDAANLPLKILLDLDRFQPHFWPLVLYGNTGSGKTALADSAVLRFAQWANPEIANPSARLISATDFARGLAESIQTKSVEAFVERLLSYQAIAFDNLEALEHYPAAQSEFVSILDRLLELKIPVIVTMRTAPENCGGLSATITSRLSAGLSLPVNLPGFEARCHLIAKLAEKYGLGGDEAFAVSLAKKYPLSLPQLNRLVLETKNQRLVESAPTSVARVQSTKHELSEVPLSDQQKFDLTVKVVSEYFQIAPSVLNSASRKQTTVLARSLAIFLAREVFAFNYSTIGEFFSGRDHSTILHAHKKISKQFLTNSDFSGVVNSLKSSLLEITSSKSVTNSLCE